jgi:ABC-type antimicrobial peptide transport system permease subunit
VRVALGATRARVVAAVLRSAAWPIVVGLGAGLTLAAGAAGALGQALRDAPVALDPADPASYGAAIALVATAALAAMLVPALRAAAADPVRALRRD